MCVPMGAPDDYVGAPRLYDVLGINIKATAEEIRVSYIRLARRWHPDRHGGAENAKRVFQQIQSAYEVLSNERRRAHYDLQWLQLLDVESYLARFKDLILTANGLGLSLSSLESLSSIQEGFSVQEQDAGQEAECSETSEGDWDAASGSDAPQSMDS